MIVKRQTGLGEVTVDIPINIGDVIIHGGTKYPINRIIMTDVKGIYVVNQSSGL